MSQQESIAALIFLATAFYAISCMNFWIVNKKLDDLASRLGLDDDDLDDDDLAA